MATEVLMPKLGLTMTEGTIEKWYKKEGDAVKKGEMLFAVATDKLTNDVEADTDGTLLKIITGEGDTADCFGLHVTLMKQIARGGADGIPPFVRILFRAAMFIHIEGVSGGGTRRKADSGPNVKKAGFDAAGSEIIDYCIHTLFLD